MRALNMSLAHIELTDQLAAPWTSIVTELAETAQADACSIFAVDERQGEYVLLATKGLHGAVVGKTRLHFGTGLVGLVGERGEVVNLEDAHLHPNFEVVPQIDETAFNAFLGVPIIYRSEALGVLVLQRQAQGAFSTEIIAELMTLAPQLGEAMAKASAKGELQRFIEKGRKQDPEKVLAGVSGAPGIAMGEAMVVFPPADLDAVPDREIKNKEVAAECVLFSNALLAVREEIQDLKKRAHSVLSLNEQELFDAFEKIRVIGNVKNIYKGVVKNILQKISQDLPSLDSSGIQAYPLLLLEEILSEQKILVATQKTPPKCP